MHLLIDNYDSFTYNVAQALGELGEKFEVFRHDAIDIERARSLEPRSIIISPGPGRPEDAGISVELIRQFHETTPILGICLGHQCIVAAFEGSIERPRCAVLTGDARVIFEGLAPSEAWREG